MIQGQNKNHYIHQKEEPEQNHKNFQFSSNPMQMSAFEQGLVLKEKIERRTAKQKYVMGIQGVDGGKCY